MDFGKLFTPGLSGEVVRRVSRAMCSNPTKQPGAEVLSTPALVRLLERACILACQGHLPHGFTTVSYHVDLRHLAPAPKGKRLRGCAQLLSVEDNRLTFAVEAYDDLGRKVGEGTFRRVVLPLKVPGFR